VDQLSVQPWPLLGAHIVFDSRFRHRAGHEKMPIAVHRSGAQAFAPHRQGVLPATAVGERSSAQQRAEALPFRVVAPPYRDLRRGHVT